MRFKTFFPLDLSSWTGPPKKYSCLLFQALNSQNCWHSIGVTFILGCKLRWQCKNSNSHMNWALLSCTRSSGNCSSSYYYILRSSSTNNNVYSSGKTFMHCITPGTLGTEKGFWFCALTGLCWYIRGLNVFFRQIKSFIRFRLAFVFGLQTF